MRLGTSGRLTGRRRPFLPDPDRVEDVLEGIMSTPYFDATHLSDLKPEEIQRNRIKMKMVLSRHGRVDFHSWEDRDLAEMVEAFEELLDVIKVEGAAREDAGA